MVNPKPSLGFRLPRLGCYSRDLEFRVWKFPHQEAAWGLGSRLRSESQQSPNISHDYVAMSGFSLSRHGVSCSLSAQGTILAKRCCSLGVGHQRRASGITRVLGSISGNVREEHQ